MISPQKLTTLEISKILWPYFAENFMTQLKSIWFIVFYLVFFQVVILQLPLVYTLTISIGIAVVILGLLFFMEGLRLGLMPLGETIGAILPRNAPLWGVLGFAFILGIGATFAEPAIAVLRMAGAGVQPDEAPLLYSLLNDFPNELVSVVGIGVGFAVMLGTLRFYYLWSLKTLIIPGVLLLTVLTLFAHNNEILNPILGLAWDCGAVTTGPVTVPLVLALGIGVCRVLGDGDTSNAGFGIVTLASLFPILAVLSLGSYHYFAKDYYGEKHYKGIVIEHTQYEDEQKSSQTPAGTRISQAEFKKFLQTPSLSKDYMISFEGGEKELVEGKIYIDEATIILEKKAKSHSAIVTEKQWNNDLDILQGTTDAVVTAARAIIPLCAFLLITLWFLLKTKGEKFKSSQELWIGIFFALIGMALFTMGIILGLTPLGSQLGGNIPSTFSSLTPWEMQGIREPLFETEFYGKLVAIAFGFFLGYGATLAEPALNALGDTVEKITVGAFRKRLLMQSVAIGVGLGIATGVLKIAYNIPLSYFLIPSYLLLLIITWFSTEEFVNFGWDSAGVTTGPITVPLVLAMGLGIGGAVPGVIDGFGILALASVGPILTVLTVGLIVARTSRNETVEA